MLWSGRPLDAQAAELRIDVGKPTGPILHGASGWLYGQAAPGIPSVNLMHPLQPQISAQKPAGGLQHPAGDVSLVAPDYRLAGGKLLQIYLQDMYPDWPYNDRGIEEYLRQVDAMTRRIVADSNHELMVYVPFNEPNNNWYADSGPKFTKFLHDWTLVVRRIRALDPGAKIAGPGFEHFNESAFATFLAYAKEDQVLPDEFTWHELHDDFFPEWYRRVVAYRASEKKLGIGPLPIVINEYAREKRDLAVPGQLVQWIARLENSKVYGCLAFWTPSGTLSDLGARIWPNRPTGAWWLYASYGSMRGQTVAVTPPDRDAPGLQGIATVDETTHQVRAIFGGSNAPIKVRLLGLQGRPAWRAGVHVAVSRIRSSGIEPSPEPEEIVAKNTALSGAELEIEVPAGASDAAYSLVVTPQWSASGSVLPAERPAVLADREGTAATRYADPRGTSVSLGRHGDAGVAFLASVDHDGYYSLRLRYAPADGSPESGKPSHLVLKLNREPGLTLSLPGTAGEGWNERSFRVFLPAGVNQIAFSASPAAGDGAVALHSLEIAPTQGRITRYEAESPANSLGGTAHTITIPDGSGRIAVAGIGSGLENYLQFNAVVVPAAGRYHVIVTYANDEQGHKGQVEESSAVEVNGRAAGVTWFRNTFSASVFATTTLTVSLNAGTNSLRVTNAMGQGPVIDRVEVAEELEISALSEVVPQ